MTRDDLRILCTALGFLAVVQQDVPMNKQALRATSIARLIESFCITSLPEAIERLSEPTDTENLLNSYITELRESGSASLSFSRPTLFRMYELLHIRKLRNEQKEFYASSSDDMVANRILQLTEEEIASDEAGT